jgi:mono/diheme cytochrome c family protein
VLCLRAAGFASYFAAQTPAILHEHRSAPGDLEVGGDLAGLPGGGTRFVRYEDLLKLPQETYSVSDDANFRGTRQITGVGLQVLAAALGEGPDMLVAVCNDGYRSNYPPAYLAGHHPLLVLSIDGRAPERWPPSEYGGSMAPFLISHPFFKPSFRVLSHDDEAQIPYGVVRIEFRSEAQVFGGIRPRGKWAADSRVSEGHLIARQDCFRCHNRGSEGGTMAGHSWLDLAKVAASDGERFRKIIHDPQSVRKGARMPAHADYDAATLEALTAYFRTFAKPGEAEHNGKGSARP